MTRHYVAVDWTESVRLAQLDGTLLNDIRCHENVELLHRTHWWAWWSDDRLTTSVNLPDNFQPETLSLGAAELISDVWEGGLIRPQCGWTTLADVKSVSDCQVVYAAGRNNDVSNSKWEKLTLFFEQDRQGFLYRHRYYDESGYKCDIAYDYP
jgi:hypothetical protein